MHRSYNSEGLLSKRLLSAARWAGKDPYPAHPEYSVELEGLLAFIQAHNRVDSFWPRLTGEQPQQRDDALQEIRVARFLTANGFPIAQWEPLGSGNLIGEFSVQILPSSSVFVEVQRPGWKSELTAEEIAAGRAKKEKYQDLESGAVGPAQKIRMSVRKKYPKFLPSQPNLLVIADDLFVPLPDWGDLPVKQALFLKSKILEGEAGYFVTPRFENLGGVALFKVKSQLDNGLLYEFVLYPNPMARPETELPKSFTDVFVKAQAAGN